MVTLDFYGTLGTACRDQETIYQMFQAGMTGARLNLSHTNLTQCDALLRQHYWPAAARAGVKGRLIVDLQGPEVRVGHLDKPVPMPQDSQVVLGRGGVPVPEQVLHAARKGDHISLDDSAMLLEVTAVEREALTCRVLRGGTLSSRKNLAILGVALDAPTLTEEDMENLRLGAEYGVTDVLQPFVRGRQDVDELRRAMRACGLGHARVMAKIENRQGLEHLQEIIDAADVICIARGDLGNSMPLWDLPSAQKYIARCCRRAGRSFFVVTQMLWSMQGRAVPTRAEVCDVYNAVLDGADALMLTGETAVGKYPAQAMEYLTRTAKRALEDLAEEQERGKR